MTTFRDIIFDTPLDIRREIEAVKRDGESVEGILLRDWSITFGWKARRWRLLVPAGFLAAPSVPKAFRSFASFWDGGFEASVAHDWAYRTRCFDPYGGRRLADNLYLDLMAASDVPEYRRARNYDAVRAFGGSTYRRNIYRDDNGLYPI